MRDRPRRVGRGCGSLRTGREGEAAVSSGGQEASAAGVGVGCVWEMERWDLGRACWAGPFTCQSRRLC